VVVVLDELLAEEEVALEGLLLVAWTIPYATPPKKTANAAEMRSTTIRDGFFVGSVRNSDSEEKEVSPVISGGGVNASEAGRLCSV
jgi:hypothetical protein